MKAIARRLLGALSSVALLAAILAPPTALADGLEVTEVRTDNYPRVTVRFTASMADGSPVTDLKPGQVQAWESDAAQPQVDFYSLRERTPELWVALVVDVSGSMN